MYDKIMRYNRESFFAFLNVELSEFDEKGWDTNSANQGVLAEEKFENEWMQEYHLIYNSYILEGKEY